MHYAWFTQFRSSFVHGMDYVQTLKPYSTAINLDTTNRPRHLGNLTRSVDFQSRVSSLAHVPRLGQVEQRMRVSVRNDRREQLAT